MTASSLAISRVTSPCQDQSNRYRMTCLTYIGHVIFEIRYYWIIIRLYRLSARPCHADLLLQINCCKVLLQIYCSNICCKLIFEALLQVNHTNNCYIPFVTGLCYSSTLPCQLIQSNSSNNAMLQVYTVTSHVTNECHFKEVSFSRNMLQAYVTGPSYVVYCVVSPVAI